MTALGETILVVDDDPYIQEALGDRLESLGYRVSRASDGQQALELIDHQDPQMVFLDIEMPGMKGLDVLREIRKREKDFPVVMITAYGSIDLAVEAMKEGAYDFIPKPFKANHIALVVEKAMERQRLRREKEVLSEEVDKRYRLVAGNSTKLNAAIGAAKKAAASKSTILLLGESGTGKELFARAIHNWSERKDRPFIAINCVGLSKELLESELFGYEKGAFTGASQLKRGKIEIANGGTVFLDEVGDISEELQAKLLRFLQEREFERVGGTQLIRVDVRIIAATNRNLDAAVKEGRFREDLFYRINVVPIVLPPLRGRKEDVPSLAQFFMQRFSIESKKSFTDISQEALEALHAYDWPGNVRELANVIERAVVLGQPPTIQIEDLSPGIVAAEAETESPSTPQSYHESIDEYRREVIVNALAQTQGNRAAAARLLGLQRSYLLRLMKSFEIS
ncbi:MAG TPA: sigma-54 dependent transcriptional regulator [Candidatus Bathyarchaeia archaeon]|jgi:DNA-binding NtrC family response regulator|nr:sigma-54 dependent transcriptional regulator [Candidatus Bathyarchaeia archaeon]